MPTATPTLPDCLQAQNPCTVSIDVLANDSDPGGDAPSGPTVSSGPVNGAVIVNGDGTINYAPNTVFCGPDLHRAERVRSKQPQFAIEP